MKKTFKIAAGAIVMIAVLAGVIAGSAVDNGKPKRSDDGSLVYQGREYHLVSAFAEVYEYELGDKLGTDFLEKYYSIKDDDNVNFIIVSGFNSSSIYTCVPISKDYFNMPSNPKEAEIFSGDNSKTITNEKDLETLYYFLHYKGKKMVEYNPDECTLIEYKIKDKKMPVSLKYKHKLFAYDGAQWLVHADEKHYDACSIYYAYVMPEDVENEIFADFLSSYTDMTNSETDETVSLAD